MHREPILIVEDEPDARETLRLLLELEGFEVAVAADGREALQVLAQIGRPCLILLDLMMPVMNGWEFLDALENGEAPLAANTPILVISAAADVGNHAAPTAYRMIRKPFAVEPLLSVVREYCSGA